MKNYFNISVVILSIFSVNSIAINWDSQTGKKGYWNYEITPQKTNQKNLLPKVPPPPPTLPATELLMQMHPDQIQILVKAWRKHAIYTLQPSDVSEALRIQDVARKKASSYAAVVGLVNQINPNLTLADEIPITNAGRQIQFSGRKRAMSNYLNKSIRNYGLLYFSSKTCEYCRLQDHVLEQFLAEFRFDIKVVELEKEPLMAARFNIKQTPSIIIVNRTSKKHLPVAFGATSLPRLKESVYRAIRYIQEEITPAQFFTNEKDIGTGLDPNNKRQ